MEQLIFNSLKRNQTYRVVMEGDLIIEQVFHEYLPDGTLRFTTCVVNPHKIVAVFF